MDEIHSTTKTCFIDFMGPGFHFEYLSLQVSRQCTVPLAFAQVLCTGTFQSQICCTCLKILSFDSWQIDKHKENVIIKDHIALILG